MPESFSIKNRDRVFDLPTKNHRKLIEYPFEFKEKNKKIDGLLRQHVFHTDKEAEDFLENEKPQRPSKDFVRGRLRIIQEKYSFWIKQNNSVSFFLLYPENKDWLALNQNEYSLYQQQIEVMIEEIIAKWN